MRDERGREPDALDGCDLVFSALDAETSTQATFGVRQQIANSLNIPESQVTVISEFMGGGFGSKFPEEDWKEAFSYERQTIVSCGIVDEPTSSRATFCLK